MNSDALRRYPDMKSSGLPWAKEVPQHWELLPNRTLMRKRKLLVGAQHGSYQLLSLTKQGIIVRDVDSGKGKFSADMGTSQEVRPGDLVFCLFDIAETPRTVGMSRHLGMITGAYTVFECPDRQLGEFVELFYRAMDDRKLLSPLYSGLRNTIPPSRFLGIKTPIPPREERSAIIQFLNHADKRVRKFIRAKQKLTKLLEEEKQAIVQRIITRGLDRSARQKPSGTAWLGDVPEHWEVRRAKYLFREVDIRSTSGSEELLSLRMYKGLVPHKDVSSMPISAEALVGYKKVEPGQIVMNRMRAAIGMFGVAPQPGLVSPDYAVFSPDAAVSAEYYVCLFRTLRAGAVFRLESKGLGTGASGFMRLYTDRFGTIKLPVPPRDEQTAIVECIKTETQEVERVAERVHREIVLLREFGTRLVSDVVTGKIDVREAAAKLPIVEPEADVLDEIDDVPQDEESADTEELEAEDAA